MKMANKPRVRCFTRSQELINKSDLEDKYIGVSYLVDYTCPNGISITMNKISYQNNYFYNYRP